MKLAAHASQCLRRYLSRAIQSILQVQSAIRILDTPHAMAGVAKLLFSALSAAPAMLSSADLSPTSSSPGEVAVHEAH